MSNQATSEGSKRFTQVWEGLWDYKHAQKLGKSMVLFGYLTHMANKHGIVKNVSYLSIMQGVNIEERTAKRWLKNQVTEGYIFIEYGHGKANSKIEKIIINNWRSTDKDNFGELINNHSSVPEKCTEGRVEKDDDLPKSVPKMTKKCTEDDQKVYRRISQPDKKQSVTRPLKGLKGLKENTSVIDKKKKVKKPKKKTNPEISILIDFYHNNFLGIHSFKPETGAKAAGIFTTLLKKRSCEDLKKLILAYLKETDDYVTRAGWPVNLLSNRINSLIQSGVLKRSIGEDQATKRIAEEFKQIQEADFQKPTLTDWYHKITQLKIMGSRKAVLSTDQIEYLNHRLKELDERRTNGNAITG